MLDLKEKFVVGKMKLEFEICNCNKVWVKVLYFVWWCVIGFGVLWGNC